MEILVYTFRTNPFRYKIPGVFIFGKLKQDFDKFSKEIIEKKPEIILGISATKRSSRFEKEAINQFNNNKKINKDGPNSIQLHIPKETKINIANRTYDSFCNWTAYKIAKLVEDEQLNTKVMFAHIQEKDLEKVIPFQKS